MNYRHHFHAGNFADVFKHVLLIQLVKGLQRKDKPFVYLDTHAGRGRYDLSTAAYGDSLARLPEHPDGIGRLWRATGLPEPLAEYVEFIRRFDRAEGNLSEEPRFYPGSPLIATLLARDQDRIALCEKHPEEFAGLGGTMSGYRRVSLHDLDGYAAIKAMLPPLEKRALVLIDPPYEDKAEFGRIAQGLAQGLRRFSGGTYAVWYPLTERARVDDFLAEMAALHAQPMFVAEIAIAPFESERRMKGCGLLVINPPWQIDRIISPALPVLARLLAQEPGGEHRLKWLVPET